MLLGALSAVCWAGPSSSFSHRDRTLTTDLGQFMVSEPLGWLLDNHPAGVEETIAVLYPKGTSLQTAPSVIYIYILDKEDIGFKDLKSYIAKDCAEVLQDDPKVEEQPGPTLSTRIQKAVPTRFFQDGGKGRFEGTAYIEEKEAVVRFSLESGDAKIFNEDLPALQELVASYEWLWDRTEDKY